MTKFLNLVISKLPNKLRYFVSFSIYNKKIPNLINPRDYQEYIFRDIFLNRNNKRYILADKYRARAIVEKKGLGCILPKVYGCWQDAREINFSQLPEKFVLKTNHSCNFNIVCHNKDTLNFEYARKKLNGWLKTKHQTYFETHYHKIKPVIFCEEFIDDKKGIVPIDYKFHCANGEPVFILVVYNRGKNGIGTRLTFDINWNKINFINSTSKEGVATISRPQNLDKMVEYARILSSGMKYIRIDFYDTGDKVFFGEFTLAPLAGILFYYTDDAIKYMGEKIRNYY